MTEIFHNPKCSKSRKALDILKEKQEDYVIVEYLKDVPTKERIKEILSYLNCTVDAVMRKGEEEYKLHIKGKKLTDEEKIDLLIQYPKIIERPIVIKDKKAAIGRPPENIISIL